VLIPENPPSAPDWVLGLLYMHRIARLVKEQAAGLKLALPEVRFEVVVEEAVSLVLHAKLPNLLLNLLQTHGLRMSDIQVLTVLTESRTLHLGNDFLSSRLQ